MCAKKPVKLPAAVDFNHPHTSGSSLEDPSPEGSVGVFANCFEYKTSLITRFKSSSMCGFSKSQPSDGSSTIYNFCWMYLQILEVPLVGL